MITRRTALAFSTAALLAGPARANGTDWTRVRDRARGLDQLHSLTVAQGGTVVLAEALRGPALSRAVPIKSVSKSLVALLLGAAIDRGEIAGVDATLAEVAPQLIPAGADPRVPDLTMADLVTMQTGLERTSGANYGGWVSSRNWVANALSRPMVATPGQGMLYSTGSFHILGAALAEATGLSLLAQMRRRIGAPLGIDIPAWTRDPQGYYLGGNEMSLRPRDLLAIGEMVRLGGAAEGGQVISNGWLSASAIPRTQSRFSGLGYGYGWFLGRADGAEFLLARGYGGQILCIVPDRALTLVITSDPTRPARSGGYFGDLMALLDDAILPAARAA
ncbi:serine hydrolase [Dinoroseobacter sp. PD6]|uniref:serine hydrolase domain-containing protein n=1 Tax=Dinoroseobacter sp. PD6 TaxID=3028384 RepID=UPI00237B11F8|nr:serine hydrolase [Dinoroseobacter sp. PD6]MDD9716040.1 serine hydrolase [Dinoroseobacter sp. PD6]